MIVCYTYRPVPYPITIEEASSVNSWEQLQRPQPEITWSNYKSMCFIMSLPLDLEESKEESDRLWDSEEIVDPWRRRTSELNKQSA